MSKYLKHLVYRPSPEPATGLPIGARSVGHYYVNSWHQESAMRKHFVQVFWGVAGKGRIVYDEGPVVLGPQQIAIYLPGMSHVLRTREAWEYRWWTMDGPLAEATVTAFGLRPGIRYHGGKAPIPLFEELDEAIRHITPAGERRASAIAYELLTWAAGGVHTGSEDRVIDKAVAIIHDEWHLPSLGVDALAARLNIDRSQFSRRFRETMGIAPIQYMNNVRIQRALSLLKSTDTPIGEIALQCGYADANYFSRVIRRATGKSPRIFRQI